MNCSQARALLATYRELPQNHTDAHALEEHLVLCADCRAAADQDAFIGKSIRALPELEPLPGAHTRLMQALAEEHVRFIQHTPISVTSAPTPAFLASYVKDLAQQSAHRDTIVAFSTADTGPLPLVRPGRRRSFYHMNNFAILGLAASVLMVLMIGGITSLLLLANQNSGGGSPANISHTNTDLTLSQVLNKNYSTSAPYAHVASALASGNTIYYTAYDDSATNWMLEAFDNQTSSSTPLLTMASSSPLVVEGINQNYLVWLQMDPGKGTDTTTSQNQVTTSNLARSWSLHARFLGKSSATDTTTATDDTPLYSDTFNPNSVPAWVHSPLQGITFTQNALLVSLVDGKGISHLWSYPIDYTKGKTTAAVEIAQAKNGHILAFPTATSNNTDIYWAEEWWSNNTNMLTSNIWTQQLEEAQPERVGRWAAHMVTRTYLFRADEHSFHPQLIQNTLFLLTTSNTVTKNAVTPTPTATTVASQPTPTTVTATATPTTPSVDVSGVLGGAVRVDPTVFIPQIDATIAGTLLSFSANGALAYPAPTDHTVSALQGGTRFLVWQNSANEFEMYDAVAKTSVAIEANMVPKTAAFLAVNSDMAVWVVNPASSTGTDGQTNTNVSFQTFEWPVLIKNGPRS